MQVGSDQRLETTLARTRGTRAAVRAEWHAGTMGTGGWRVYPPCHVTSGVHDTALFGQAQQVRARTHRNEAIHDMHVDLLRVLAASLLSVPNRVTDNA